MGRGYSGASATIRAQPWLSLFAAALAVSAALLLTLRSQLGFFLDDWALVIYREGSPTDWLLPHHEHIIVLPAAIYKASLAVFGMTALPLHLVALALFLLSIWLLFLWLRPLVGDPASVLGCVILLFLGAGAEDLLWAFQMGFFGSVAGGLAAMLMIRRGTRRADGWACLLLVVALLFSSLALPFVAGSAIQLLFREDRPHWRAFARRSWIVLVPLLAFAVWWLGWGHLASSGMSLHNAVRDPLYALSALAYGAAVITGLYPVHELNESYLWAIPGLLVLPLLGLVIHRRRRLPPELLIALVTAFSFWLLTGLNLIPGRGFHASRYQYPDAIFLLMIIAGAFAGLRPDRRTVKWIAVLAAFSIAVNLAALLYTFQTRYRDYVKRNQISFTAIELARDSVDPGFTVGVSDDDQARVDAGSYLAAAGKYGSPAMAESQISDASSDNRDRLDQLLADALKVRSLPARAVIPNHTACRTLAAAPSVTEAITVKSGLLWIRSDGPALIRLGRFGDEPRAVGGLVAAREPTGYLIPPDRSDRPWRIGFQGSGQVEVCAAISAG